MELTSLNFISNTSELEKASQVINQLVQDMSKVSVSSTQMAKVQAQTEAILARAAKDSAKARTENAKAADQELKSAITADKADNAREKSITKTTNAVKKSTEASEKNVSILQRQSDILEFQTQGWSKGQSSILATAKAAQVATEDMESLQRVLETQRKLMGSDPFDKSISGLKSLQNQYGELKEAIRQYNSESNLTAKQTKEVARDKERIIEKLKVEGASFTEVRSAIRAYNREYVNLATQYNKLNTIEASVVKSRKEIVSATNYVTEADKRMAAALNASNAALDQGGTNDLVKYENALRKSGETQDDVTRKLANYKIQLAQVAGQEEKRKINNLSRSLAPQGTDVVVSLYSGQAPLTVLLQQGGQILDLFKLSGIEAQNFGKAMKESFYSMIPAMGVVLKGVGDLAAGLFIDAGRFTTRLISDLIGISTVVELTKRAVVSGGEANFKYIASLDRMGERAAKGAAIGIFSVVTVLATLALEYKKIVQGESALSKALATTGGAMNLSKNQAVEYARSLNDIGVGTLKAQEAIIEFSKAGKIGSEGLDSIIQSSILLEKYAGTALSETAKNYAKLQDGPTKALTELAESTGLVDKATLAHVASLEQQGKMAEAVQVATEAMKSANTQAALEIKSNLSPIEVLWLDIKSAISGAKDEIYNLTTSSKVIDGLRTVWQTLAVIVSETWYVLKGVGIEIGGIGAQIAAVMRGDFSGAKNIGDMMKADAVAARAAHDANIASIMKVREVQSSYFNEQKGQNSQYASWRKENDQAMSKSESKESKLAAKQKELSEDRKNGLITEIEYNKALAGWKDIIMGKEKSSKSKSPSTKKPPEESFFDKSMKQFRNDAIAAEVATDGLVKSQVALLKIVNDPLFDKWSMKEKLAVLQIAAKAIGLEQEAEAQKALNKAKEDFEKQRTKSLADQDSETAKINEKAQLIEDEIAQYGMGKRAIVEMSIARDLERKSILLQMGATKEEVAYIDELILAKQRLANAEDIKKNKDDFSNQSKTDLKELNDFLDPAKADKFGEALTKAFDGAGNALSKLVNVFDDYARRDAELAQMKAKLYAETDPIKYKLKEIALDKKSRDAQLTTYASVAGAAKGFFKEGSRGYKTMEKVETTFRAVQLAGAIKEAAIKIGLISAETTAGVAGQATLTGATIAGAAARVTALIPNIIAAFSAVLGPFGPPAAYAMLAAIGISASGAGKAKELPKTNQGTGTVFGDKDAKSESVSKSVQLLESISKFNEIENAYAAKMLFSLKSIESQIQGFTSVLLRNGGVKAAGDSVKQGYAPNGLTKAGSLASTAVSVAALLAGTLGPIGFIVGAIVGKLLGPLINKLFGTKTTVTGQGLYTKDATVSQIANGDLEAGYYADINKKKKFFGATYSNKNSTQYTKDDEASKQVSMIINSFVDSIKTAAPILGFSLDQIDDNLKDFVVKIGKIDLKDLKGAEIQEKLNAVFGAAGDGIAKAAIPGLEHLAEVGEGYLETLVRVATNLSSVNQMFDVLGVNLYESSIAGAEASLAMSELFGGLDKLTETLSSYYKNFYTEEERMAKLTQDLTVKFKGMNKELPKTRDEFRALATELLNGGPEAQALAAEVLLLADAFNTTAEYADKLAKEQEEKVKKAKEDAQKAKEKAINDAYSSLEKAVKAEQKILQDREKAAQDSVTRLKSIFDVLKQNIQELYNQVESTSAMNSIKGKSVISSALTSGELPDSKELADAIGAVRKEIDSTSYETIFEQEKAKLQLAGDLVILQKSAEVQLSNAELQLKSLKDQNLNLEALLESMRKSVDTELGIDTSVKSVEQAVKDLMDLLAPAKKTTDSKPASGGASFGGGGSAGASRPAAKYSQVTSYGTVGIGYEPVIDVPTIERLDKLSGLYHSFDGTGDLVGLLTAIKGAGGSIDDLSKLSGYFQADWRAAANSVGITPFADGGVFANQVVSSPTSFDMGLMGEAGPEAIMPLTSINGKLGVASNNSSSKALEDKVQNLSIELRAIAINTGKVSRLLERVTRDGESMIVATEV